MTMIEVRESMVSRDPALPAMSMLFDVSWMARLLEEHSAERIWNVRPVYMRYKRRTSCLVAYEVSGSIGDSIIHAKALRRSEERKLAKHSERATVNTWLGDRPLIHPDLALTVWAYPNDARLKWMRLIDDEDGVARLTRRLKDRAPGRSLTRLSYKPQRRFVAAVSANQAQPVAVMKMYAGDGYANASAASELVASRDVLRIPLRIASDVRRSLLFFEWLPGRSVAEPVSAGEPLGSRLEPVGQALAELHNQPLPKDAVRSRSYGLPAVRSVLSDMRLLFPGIARRLQRIRSGLEHALTDVHTPQTPIHGDFHLRQVLLSGSSVAVVDFDRAGGGPAAGDVGFCVANLERDVLAGSLSRGCCDTAVEEFLFGYGRIRQRPSKTEVDVYTALGLTLLLPEPVRLFVPDALEVTDRMIERIESLLGSIAMSAAVS